MARPGKRLQEDVKGLDGRAQIDEGIACAAGK